MASKFDIRDDGLLAVAGQLEGRGYSVEFAGGSGLLVDERYVRVMTRSSLRSANWQDRNFLDKVLPEGDDGSTLWVLTVLAPAEFYIVPAWEVKALILEG